MNEQSNANIIGAKKAVIDALRQRAKTARFITEVAASLRRFNIDKEEMEQALSELQDEGVVIVRDNFCADPHLANVDLRVASLVDGSEGADAQVAALREIDLAWNKWLAEYLANHRCG
jgi:DNA-directed RNA polymerase specialized sigma subunit